MSTNGISIHLGEDSHGGRTWQHVDIDCFLRDYNSQFTRKLWHETGSQFTLGAVVTAAYVLSLIVARGSSRVDLPDNMKMGMVQAIICHIIAHTDARNSPDTDDVIALVCEITDPNVDKDFLKDFFHHAGKWSTPAGRICVHYVRDAIALFPAFMPHPRNGVKEEIVWVEIKHRMEMAAAFMHSQPGRDLYGLMLPHWLATLGAMAAPEQLKSAQITAQILQQQEVMIRAQQAIKNLANTCPHPADAVTEERTSDTGNWDRGDDTYFRVVTCKVCGSQFSYSKNTGRNMPEVLDRTTQLKLPVVLSK